MYVQYKVRRPSSIYCWSVVAKICYIHCICIVHSIQKKKNSSVLCFYIFLSLLLCVYFLLFSIKIHSHCLSPDMNRPKKTQFWITASLIGSFGLRIPQQLRSWQIHCFLLVHIGTHMCRFNCVYRYKHYLVNENLCYSLFLKRCTQRCLTHHLFARLI